MCTAMQSSIHARHVGVLVPARWCLSERALSSLGHDIKNTRTHALGAGMSFRDAVQTCGQAQGDERIGPSFVVTDTLDVHLTHLLIHRTLHVDTSQAVFVTDVYLALDMMQCLLRHDICAARYLVEYRTRRDYWTRHRQRFDAGCSFEEGHRRR